MKDELQLFPPLDPAAHAALWASIERHGVLVPVVKDQHGRILDGHNRARIADELGIDYPTNRVTVTDDEHAYELAGTLNLARRHLDAAQRRRLAADLRAEGHSLRAIGRALGVSKSQVQNDLDEVSSSGHLPPERVTGADGKSYPATRPARTVEPGDEVTDDSGDTLTVTEVDELVLHAGDDQALIVEPDRELPVVSKPDVGGGVSHPARFSKSLLPVLAAAVPPEAYPTVLDPFAGTGRIHELPNDTVGVELEPEWAGLHPATVCGSALELPFPDASFDAVVTSPTYGNRLADHHDAADPERRRSYTHDLGRALHEDNSGAMQWGERYREFHADAWAEVWRVLRPGGRLVLNVKDHIRGGHRQHVAGWHVTELIHWCGLALVWCTELDTGNLRAGENADARLPEQIFVLDKPEAAAL
jgi:SAM-dependent methyltransferase